MGKKELMDDAEKFEKEAEKDNPRMPQVKQTLVCEIPCPHCEKMVQVMKRTKIFKKAQPADKDESYFAQKGIQTTL